MGNTFWVTDVKSKGLWELWETACLAVFQGAVRVLGVHGSGSVHGRFSDWGSPARRNDRAGGSRNDDRQSP
jgi:hypothetical protein